MSAILAARSMARRGRADLGARKERGADGERAKLAELIANAIERDIISLKVPAGHPLGNESELGKRYGVSRWVLREAFAITERNGLTEVRRGRAGGLVVGGAPDRALAAAICNYLLFSAVQIEDLIKIRKVIDRLAFTLAATRLDDVHLARARELLTGPGDATIEAHTAEVYDHIMCMAANPLISVFGRALARLTLCMSAARDLTHDESNAAVEIRKELLATRHRMLECILAADASGCVEATGEAAKLWRLMFDLPESQSALTPALRTARAEDCARRILAVLHPNRPPKRSALVATRMALDIQRNGLRPGDPIGAEVELMEMYNAGRQVLREAIRTLEQGNFVQTYVGRQGGVRVGRPSSSTLVDRTVAHLEALKMPQADIQLVAGEIQVLMSDMVALRVRRLGVGILGNVLRAMRGLRSASAGGASRALEDFYSSLAEATGNSAIQLIVDVTNALTRGRGGLILPPQHLDDALTGLASAFRTGDSMLARRTMAQFAKLVSALHA